MEFKIIKKSKNSKARRGILKTKHGEIQTPCLVPVATQATIKTLDSQEAKKAKCQILICNTFHLHLKPGEKIVKNQGGLHQFMNWNYPLMTDSGGFQVFSLGFGRDFNFSKIAKKEAEEVRINSQPKLLKITKEGVLFNSPINGEKVFLGPKESMQIQKDLGADIVFAFDECPPPNADYQYVKKSLQKTHQWAKECREYSSKALFGIVQGGKYLDLRTESAEYIKSLDFEGFGIGGEFGKDNKAMEKMLNKINSILPEEKPRHLLGIGYLKDIPKIIGQGIDTFDCTVPTHYARRGIAFINKGISLDLNKTKFLKDKNPLDKECSCFVCQNYKRSYISHLLRAKEITGLKLLTFHNLYYFNSFVEGIRKNIDK